MMELEYKNPITQKLEGKEIYSSQNDITIHKYPTTASGKESIAIIYFSNKKGLITRKGFNELLTQLEKIKNNPYTLGVIITDNRNPSDGKFYTSFPGLDIKEFI